MMKKNISHIHSRDYELGQIITTHLRSCLEVYRFRAVCRSWRSLLPLSHLQASLFPLHLPDPESSHSSLSSYLFPFTICRLEPSNSNPHPSSLSLACLTRVEESIHGQMQLLNPLSNQHLKTHYNLHPKTLNLLDFRLIQLGQFYSLKSPSGSPVDSISKTLVLQKHEILCLFRDGKLGFWKFGNPEWNEIDQGNSLCDDIILHRNQVYIVDRIGTVWWMNSRSLELIKYSPPLYLSGQKKNLVESEGDLYIVDRYLSGVKNRVSEMRVYKLDEEWGTWIHIPWLGDRLFVMGIDFCLSASAVGLARNSIFFTDSCDEDPSNGGVSGYESRVFRLYDRSIRMVACSSDHIFTFSLPLEWLTSEGRKYMRTAGWKKKVQSSDSESDS